MVQISSGAELELQSILRRNIHRRRTYLVASPQSGFTDMLLVWNGLWSSHTVSGGFRLRLGRSPAYPLNIETYQ